MDKKPCIECAREFYGRSDKKFCTDVCRNAFHNKEKAEENQVIKQTNGILRRNRKILTEAYLKGKTRTNKEKLLLQGFNFSYFTNIYRTSQGKEYFFCYEKGYIFLENEVVQIVMKKDYVE
jgi:YHS domain-containing protein